MTTRCPACDTRLVEIAMLVDERSVSMRSCTRCDRRWWTADGTSASPADVFAADVLRR